MHVPRAQVIDAQKERDRLTLAVARSSGGEIAELPLAADVCPYGETEVRAAGHRRGGLAIPRVEAAAPVVALGLGADRYPELRDGGNYSHRIVVRAERVPEAEASLLPAPDAV